MFILLCWSDIHDLITCDGLSFVNLCYLVHLFDWLDNLQVGVEVYQCLIILSFIDEYSFLMLNIISLNQETVYFAIFHKSQWRLGCYVPGVLLFKRAGKRTLCIWYFSLILINLILLFYFVIHPMKNCMCVILSDVCVFV